MQIFLFIIFFFFSLALGSPADVLYIKKLVADEAQICDTQDFAGLTNIFTRNATYNTVNIGGPVFFGIDNIQATLSSFFPPDVISQNAINTESFTLLPPSNEEGAAGMATGVVYTIVSFIGQGNLTGQVYTFFAKYEDKYVNTRESPRYGGWKIHERVFVSFVSFPKVDRLEIQRGRGCYGHSLRILLITDLSRFFSSRGVPLAMETLHLIFTLNCNGEITPRKHG